MFVLKVEPKDMSPEINDFSTENLRGEKSNMFDLTYFYYKEKPSINYDISPWSDRR